MDLQLIKELKDNGFPFKEWYLEQHNGESSKLHWDNRDWEYPTLSKLMGACGNVMLVKFEDLSRAYSLEAFDYEKDDWSKHYKEYRNGKTPKIAFAKLWLALNKKEDADNK